MLNDQHASGKWRFNRILVLRVLMVLSVALYSIWGVRMNLVIVHDHSETHADHHWEAHHTPESSHDDHEDHHKGDEGEHHHHLTFSGNVAMASVTPPSHFFSQRIIMLNTTSHDEACPSGPVFEWIKPPQVS